jgi:hypothetical protein
MRADVTHRGNILIASQGPNQNTARDNTFAEKNDLARESRKHSLVFR